MQNQHQLCLLFTKSSMGRYETRIITVDHRPAHSLPDVITHGQISQTFPLHICIPQEKTGGGNKAHDWLYCISTISVVYRIGSVLPPRESRSVEYKQGSGKYCQDILPLVSVPLLPHPPDHLIPPTPNLVPRPIFR